MVKIVLNHDEMVNGIEKINHEMFQFYRFVIIKYQGKPIASGGIVIC